MQKEKFILVLRCSKEEQNKKGNSLETQQMFCTNHPRLMEMNKVAIYKEVISSWKENRRGVLEEIYRRCKRNPNLTNYVLYQKVDRFFRNTGRAWEWIEKFKAIGVQINFVEQWLVYGSGGERLMLNIRLGIAEEESFNTSRRIKQNLTAIKSKGYYTGSKAPPGYRKIVLSNYRKSLEPDSTDKLLIIEKIFKSYLYGNVSRSYFLEAAKQIGLSRTRFYQTFQNPIYAGANIVLIDGEKKFIKAHWNEYAVITIEEFKTIQERIKADSETRFKTITKQVDYWLKGHVFCERTGRRMTASASTGRSKKYKYYHAKKGTSIRVDATHDLILKLFGKFKIKKGILDYIENEVRQQFKKAEQDRANRKATAKRDIDRIDERMKELNRQYAIGEIELQEYRELKGIIEEQREHKFIIIDNVNNESFLNERVIQETIKIIPNLKKVLKQGSQELKSLILNTFFPNGFHVNVKKQIVGTVHLNKIVSELIDLEAIKNIFQINKGENNDSLPLCGDDGTILESSERDIVNLQRLISKVA